MRIIFFLMLCQNVFAQNDTSSPVESYSENFAGLSAGIKVYVPQKKIKFPVPVLVFLNKNDSSTDGSAICHALQLFADSSLPCVILKISFSDLSETSLVLNQFFLIDKLSQVQKKYSDYLLPDKIILASQNEAAAIVFSYLKAMQKNIYCGAAFFFDDATFWPGDMCKVQESYFKNLPEKMFVYVSGSDELMEPVNTAADKIALLPSLMIYKINEQNGTMKTLFAEMFLWLMAKGNNYIIQVKN